MLEALTAAPMPRQRGAHTHPTCSGFGLIETLLALALGLALVVTVTAWSLAHIAEQRRLLTQARLAQDLRSAMDLALRDLRRAAFWGQAERGVWLPGVQEPSANPYTGVLPAAGSGAAALAHQYSRDTAENGSVDANERFGLRVNATTGALEWRVAGGALAAGSGDQWQALTDPALVTITRLQTNHDVATIDLIGHCAVDRCPDSTDPTCPPRLLIHRIRLDLEGQDTRDAQVHRRLQGLVRLRNDEVQGACPSG